MTFVLFAPFATLIREDQILSAYPLLLMEQKTEVVADFQPQIKVSREKTLKVQVRVNIGEELADVLRNAGHEVYDENELDNDEDDDAEEEEEVEEKPTRGRRAKPEPEPEVEVVAPKYYVIYDTDTSYETSTMEDLTATREWSDLFHMSEKNRDRLSEKLQVYTSELAVRNTPSMTILDQNESGMTGGGLNDRTEMYAQMEAIRQRDILRRDENIRKILHYFEEKIMRVDYDEDTGEIEPSVEYLAIDQVSEEFPEVNVGSLLTDMQEVMKDVIVTFN